MASPQVTATTIEAATAVPELPNSCAGASEGADEAVTSPPPVLSMSSVSEVSAETDSTLYPSVGKEVVSAVGAGVSAVTGEGVVVADTEVMEEGIIAAAEEVIIAAVGEGVSSVTGEDVAWDKGEPNTAVVREGVSGLTGEVVMAEDVGGAVTSVTVRGGVVTVTGNGVTAIDGDGVIWEHTADIGGIQRGSDRKQRKWDV